MTLTKTSMDSLQVGSLVEVVTSLRPKAEILNYFRQRKNKGKAGIFRGVLLAETQANGCEADDHNYLVISLAKRSWPFAAGQIVWIKTDQITFLHRLSQ